MTWSITCVLFIWSFLEGGGQTRSSFPLDCCCEPKGQEEEEEEYTIKGFNLKQQFSIKPFKTFKKGGREPN